MIGPTGVRFAAVGSPVGFQLSGGSTDVTKYGFYAVDAKGVPLAQRKWVGLYFFGMTRPTNVTVQLIGKHHKVLRTWHTVTRGKVAIRKLLLPKSARRVGATYTLRSTAVSGTTVIHRTNVVRVYRSLRTMKVSQRHLVDIVVAGTQLPKKLPTVTRQARRIVSGSDSSSFTMSASLKRNVQVVVVDVDEYGVRLVHNLHLVFPRHEADRRLEQSGEARARTPLRRHDHAAEDRRHEEAREGRLAAGGARTACRPRTR